MRAALLALVIMIGGTEPATANDASLTALPNGGLSFEKTDKVQMKAETLKLSLDKVEVNYVFRNITGADAKMIIGFPLPETQPREAKAGEKQFTLPHDEDFNVWVDGKKLIPRRLIRVFLKYPEEKDITADFLALGLDPEKGEYGDETTKQKLAAMGGICSDDFYDLQDIPCWHYQKIYSWEQTFPAGKDVRVKHEYRPWVGGYAGITTGHPESCLEQQFQMKLQNMMIRDMEARDGVRHEEVDLKYVLRTGANWAGPIGKFTLEIDRGDAALISYCAIPGLKLTRTGNKFVGSLNDFTPMADLDIYFAGESLWSRYVGPDPITTPH